MAFTMPWMKKILEDRIKPFAIVVEESLEQAAHVLSSSGFYFFFYYFFSGTRMDLKWVTTTVGSWCQFWQGGMHRVLTAESGVHWLKPSLLTLIVTQTLLESSIHSGPTREGMALPGAEISQVPVSVALLGFCSLIPSEDSGAWPVMVTGSGAAHGPADMSVVRQVGQGRKSQQVGGWAQAHLLRSETSKYLLSKEK